jgi:hypothetical protein
MSKKPTPLEAHTANVIANADYFSAVVFRGRGRFERKEGKTLEEARELARALLREVGGQRPAGIYAVKDVYEVHVENVNP